jgi:dihydroorotate dehydrogenase
VPILYSLARAALFQLPAERIHDLAIDSLAALPAPARRLLKRSSTQSDRRLHTRVFGVDFENPVGLGAGFDKGAVAFNGLAALGFGFVEIGTVTAHAQPGNPRPRLFRLPADDALLNRMGFNNPGADEVARRLEGQPIETVLGINVGKSKVTPLERATEDYLASIDRLERFASYLVVNVSSPNTPGLRELQDAEPLRELLQAVIRTDPHGSSGSIPRRPPVLLKLAPDLTDSQLEQAVGIAVDAGVAGIVAVNTTISREGLRTGADTVESMGAGGISGRPLRDRAREVVERIYRQTGGSLPIVGVGGIFTAQDAWDRICAGASLIQLYTGFIYEGPGVVARINHGLASRLSDHGFRSIADAVGSGVR